MLRIIRVTASLLNPESPFAAQEFTTTATDVGTCWERDIIKIADIELLYLLSQDLIVFVCLFHDGRVA
jgi:hypothetical protein